ncbi:MAG: Ig-like domain-containing protein [Firmicutes bacterium]|nr:Ig-like domain-containing protein [Bacillota bacterium]
MREIIVCVLLMVLAIPLLAFTKPDVNVQTIEPKSIEYEHWLEVRHSASHTPASANRIMSGELRSVFFGYKSRSSFSFYSLRDIVIIQKKRAPGNPYHIIIDFNVRITQAFFEHLSDNIFHYIIIWYNGEIDYKFRVFAFRNGAMTRMHQMMPVSVVAYYGLMQISFVCGYAFQATRLQFSVRGFRAPPPPRVVITPNNVTSIRVNEILQLSASVVPATASQNIVWTSSNQSVLMVSSTGLMQAFSVGSVTITARMLTDGEIYSQLSFTVLPPEVVEPPPPPLPTNISIQAMGSTTLRVGDTLQLNFSVQPLNASRNVRWQVNNTNVATINSNGLLTAVGVGAVVVTLTALEQTGALSEISTSLSISMLGADGGLPPIEPPPNIVAPPTYYEAQEVPIWRLLFAVVGILILLMGVVVVLEKITTTKRR